MRFKKVQKSTAAAAAFALALAGCAQTPPTIAASGAPTTLPSAAITRASVIAIMDRVAKWQYAQYDPVKNLFNTDPSADGHPQGWVYATLYVGLVAHAKVSGNEADWTRLRDLAERNRWAMAPRLYNADDYAIGQLYLDLAEHYRNPDYVRPVRERLDKILANQPTVSLEFVKTSVVEKLDGRDWPLVPCRDRLCWADALYMGPPVWMALSQATGDQRYAAYGDKEFWAATDYLYDRDDDLYYRDSRFFKERTPEGKKVFWGRGNGWTVSGLARTIDQMPSSVDRSRYEALFRAHAGRLAKLQTPEGYWTSSLLATAKENPETSGTALIIYGLAWGINAGILDRATFEPVIDRGWRGLVRAVHPNGKLGWVQQVASAPGAASYDNSQLYGVGGFLMAGEQVARLKARQ